MSPPAESGGRQSNPPRSALNSLSLTNRQIAARPRKAWSLAMTDGVGNC